MTIAVCMQNGEQVENNYLEWSSFVVNKSINLIVDSSSNYTYIHNLLYAIGMHINIIELRDISHETKLESYVNILVLKKESVEQALSKKIIQKSYNILYSNYDIENEKYIIENEKYVSEFWTTTSISENIDEKKILYVQDNELISKKYNINNEIVFLTTFTGIHNFIEIGIFRMALDKEPDAKLIIATEHTMSKEDILQIKELSQKGRNVVILDQLKRSDYAGLMNISSFFMLLHDNTEKTNEAISLGKQVITLHNPKIKEGNTFLINCRSGQKLIPNFNEAVKIIRECYAYAKHNETASHDVNISAIQNRLSNVIKTCEPIFVSVSIIIPTYNDYSNTINCINSILKNTKIKIEIIIANDHSNKNTENKLEEFIQLYDNIRCISNKGKQGFLNNCNYAAMFAHGDYLFFLNNDTVTHNNWLEELLAIALTDDRIGIVGPKILFPNGSLQEAGAIVYKNGDAWNYGRGDYPDRSEYNYIKPVDYISGCGILIRTSLWRKIGGFDERFSPAYWEDVDLCFTARELGFRVIFCPKSVITHYEGGSYGKESPKKTAYMNENRIKFSEKWKDTLAKQCDSKAGTFHARDRSLLEKHILYIDHYIPMPDRDCGSRSAWNYLNVMAEMGYKIHFLPDNFADFQPYSKMLEDRGIEVLYGYHNMTGIDEWLRNNNIDYTILARPHIANKWIQRIKQTRSKTIYMAVDVHHIRLQRKYDIYKNENVLMELERYKNIEFELFRECDQTYVYSTVENEYLRNYGINSRHIPLYLYEKPSHIERSNRRDILFVGGFAHPPNEHAILWFVKDVMPSIIEKIPNMKLRIVGANMPDSIKNLCNNNIVIIPDVTEKELTEEYLNAKICIAPLLYGAGVKGKIIDAMYHGVPIVSTSIGAEGIEDAHKCMLITDEATEFAKYVIDLNKNNILYNKMVTMAKTLISRDFSTSRARSILEEDMPR